MPPRQNLLLLLSPSPQETEQADQAAQGAQWGQGEEQGREEGPGQLSPPGQWVGFHAGFPCET